MTTEEPPSSESGRDQQPGRWQGGDTQQYPGDTESQVPPLTSGAYYVVDDPLLPAIDEDELAGVRRRGGDVTDPPLLTTRRVLPLEDEPSSVVNRYLFPTEKFRGEWRRHPIALWKDMVIGVVATFAMGYATGWLAKQNQSTMVTVALLIYLAVMTAVIWRVADWYYDRFILTNKRVMVVKGLVTRNVAMMPLLRVTDMKYVQSPLGRMLNYGTFELESAGQDQALSRIEHLPNPNDLYLRIVEEMYEPEAVEARLGSRPSADDMTTDDGT